MAIIKHEFTSRFQGNVCMHCYYVSVSFIKVQLKQVLFSCVVDVAMAMSQVAFSFVLRILYTE